MNFYRALRRGTILKSIVGKEPFYWISPRPEVKEFGSKYGRWAIDTSLVSNSTVLVSFGLGEDITFETSLMEQFGCHVFGFDPTPRSVRYISENISNPRFKSFPYALADRDGLITFTMPPESVADQVSASAYAKYDSADDKSISVPCLTLNAAKAKFDIPKIDILKMDIEGAEFSVIKQAAASGWLDEISQILVEFHHFLPDLTSTKTRDSVSRIRATGFDIAWVGRTNHEYLFVRRQKRL
jgi:FkbM family methyltransferase